MTRFFGSRGTSAMVLGFALALVAFAAAGSAQPADTTSRAPARTPSPPERKWTRAAESRIRWGNGLPVADIASSARTLEDAGAYNRAAEYLENVRRRVKPDVDLEIALALDLARSGEVEAAWNGITAPALNAALADTLPVSRRHDYPWTREKLWTNGTFDGWHWYIVRARAELAAAQGLWSEALVAARQCVEARPLAGKEWLILAVCAGRAGEEGEARRAAARALVLDPTLPEAYYLNGLFAWRDGRRAEAQDRFRQAVGMDSTYRPPALALVRSALPFAAPDSLPGVFLTGIRETGLVTSPARPKLEESVEVDSPARIVRQALLAVPDSLKRGVAPAQMTLPILVDARGRIAMHELPWFPVGRLPDPLISMLVSTLPVWQFEPAERHGEKRAVWTGIEISVPPGP